jgi:hypothetical protein
MEQRAQVTSIEAIESFRAAMIVFLSKARPALEEVCADVVRTRAWLQGEARSHWEGEMRRRKRELEEAQQELFSAKLSKLQQATALQEMAVTRARRAIQEAEAKLQVIKRWDRELENWTEPLVKQVEQLHGFLALDMVKAAAYLAQVVKTLDAYAEGAPPVVAASASANPAVSKEESEKHPAEEPQS